MTVLAALSQNYKYDYVRTYKTRIDHEQSRDRPQRVPAGFAGIGWNMSTESSQWRKFLQPVVTGLVALMAAGVGYLQYLQKGESEKRDSRISVLEVQMSEQVKDMDKFKVLLYDIRSDVSFIRGKMESK